MSGRPTHGLTLIELMVAIAIAAILLGLAGPSFRETVARTRLEGAMSTLGIDLQFVRSEAIRRRTSATLAVAGGGASYVISYVPTGGDTSDGSVKTVVLPAGVTLSAATVTFDGLRGMTTVQTLTGSSDQTSAQLQVTTNAFGRITTCSPSASFHGYTAC